MRDLVLVNGVPASGKSTLAADLAARLGLPLFGIDTVKEALFAELGIGDREYSRRMGRASYHAIFATIGGFPPGMGAVVEAWHGFQPVTVLQAHLQRAGAGRVVEVWCHAPPDEIVARFCARAAQRAPGHIGLSYAEELRALAARAQPLRLGPVIDVETTRPIDGAALAGAVRAALG